jgi:cytochrome c biogenesis protein CcmG/thiol:disulfide interchange protein DsbE
MLIRLIPLVAVLLLGFLLYRGLFLNPKELPSAMVGKPVPAFSLTTLMDENKLVTQADLQGKVVLINVWATWCPTCKYEHPYLLQLAKSGRVALYGVNYNDDRAAALQYLQQYENPYVFSVFDDQGKLGLDLGIYGAPETFVIDGKGMIRKRFAGALDGNVWQREFEALIKQIEQENLTAGL